MNIEKIYAILPEHALIHDSCIRKKCAETWNEAIRIGNWEEKGIENCPMLVNIHRTDMPSKGFVHIHKVVEIAEALFRQSGEWIGQYRECEHDIVIAGALMHDVGKLLEYDLSLTGLPVYNSRYGSIKHPLSGAYLCKINGLPDKVVQCVANHSNALSAKTGKKMCTEAAIVKCADMMAARMFSSGGPDTNMDIILL